MHQSSIVLRYIVFISYKKPKPIIKTNLLISTLQCCYLNYGIPLSMNCAIVHNYLLIYSIVLIGIEIFHFWIRVYSHYNINI